MRRIKPGQNVVCVHPHHATSPIPASAEATAPPSLLSGKVTPAGSQRHRRVPFAVADGVGARRTLDQTIP
jgi:hypothetical protein